VTPAPLQHGRLNGIACLLFAAFLWGCSFPVGKAAMLAVDAYFLTSIRYGVAAVMAWQR
jgi:drug/metabolite transporter (DMT)-like permease